ncbi:MAG: tRNA-dihydrouridine synthase, partial [Bdellovibrio sp.]
RKVLDIPLSIKIRTGWDDSSINAEEVARLAEDHGIAWVAIHGRTRAQGYSGLANWDLIGRVKSKVRIPIVGNGDISTAARAVELLRTYQLDGVMIGRACLKNPAIFQQSLRLWKGENPYSEQITMWQFFSELKADLESQCTERLLPLQLKKFAAWYASGYPGAATFRKNIFQQQSLAEIVQISQDFFSRVQIQDQVDTSKESFLMGGHG